MIIEAVTIQIFSIGTEYRNKLILYIFKTKGKRMKKYDVVIIGAGPGGTSAAIQLSRAGKNVLLVDDRGKPGGECLNEGCIPSKTLEQSADYFYLLKYMSDFGINGGGAPSINWAKVVQKKDNIIKQLSEMEL